MAAENLHVKILERLSPSALENGIEHFLRDNNIAGKDVFRLDYSVVRGEVIGKGTSLEGAGRDTYVCVVLYNRIVSGV